MKNLSQYEHVTFFQEHVRNNPKKLEAEMILGVKMVGLLNKPSIFIRSQKPEMWKENLSRYMEEVQLMALYLGDY
jgi:hypothetical protein